MFHWGKTVECTAVYRGHCRVVEPDTFDSNPTFEKKKDPDPIIVKMLTRVRPRKVALDLFLQYKVNINYISILNYIFGNRY